MPIQTRKVGARRSRNFFQPFLWLQFWGTLYRCIISDAQWPSKDGLTASRLSTGENVDCFHLVFWGYTGCWCLTPVPHFCLHYPNAVVPSGLLAHDSVAQVVSLCQNWHMDQLALQIESLLFAAEQPLRVKDLQECLSDCFQRTFEDEDIARAIEAVCIRYESEEFSFALVQINDGYQFLTKGAYQQVVGHMLKLNNKRMLSKAALETLAIVAYKQPVTKVEVESIRGVNCDYTIQKLLDKELLSIKGRSDGPGKPLLYGTSDKFMDYFGLKSLADLPKLKDFQMPENEIGDSVSIVEDALRSSSEN